MHYEGDTTIRSYTFYTIAGVINVTTLTYFIKILPQSLAKKGGIKNERK